MEDFLKKYYAITTDSEQLEVPTKAYIDLINIITNNITHEETMHEETMEAIYLIRKKYGYIQAWQFERSANALLAITKGNTND